MSFGSCCELRKQRKTSRCEILILGFDGSCVCSSSQKHWLQWYSTDWVSNRDVSSKFTSKMCRAQGYCILGQSTKNGHQGDSRGQSHSASFISMHGQNTIALTRHLEGISMSSLGYLWYLETTEKQPIERTQHNTERKVTDELPTSKDFKQNLNTPNSDTTNPNTPPAKHQHASRHFESVRPSGGLLGAKIEARRESLEQARG